MPGWSANINGKTVAVKKVPFGPTGLFQEVSVPAGRSIVIFNFLPPHETAAILVAFLATVALVGSFPRVRRYRPRRSHRTHGQHSARRG